MLQSNEYFEGKVKSVAFQSPDLPATVGVMEAGEYNFSTSQREYMTVVNGKLTVLLPNSKDWEDFTDGQTFVVEANQKFDLKVDSDTAYLCKYE